MEKRNYGIDLLRIVLMYMVCILHVLDRGGVLNAFSPGTVRHSIFMALETLSYCAVNAFAMISGYMSSAKPQKYSKIIQMWFQAFFYSFVLTVIFCAVGISDWDKKELLDAALPVTTKYFWYFTAYFATFFFAPIINKSVSQIDEATAKKMLMVFILLFSVMETIAYTFIIQNGYSTIWLIVLYTIGALAKKAELFEKKKLSFLIIMFVICNLITWAFTEFTNHSRLLSYVSPTMVLSGLITVVLFSRININGMVVKNISPLVFGVYLFQLNRVIWADLYEAVAEILCSNTVVAVLQVLLVSGIIFTVGIITEYIRRWIAKLVKIPEFSDFLGKSVSKFMTRLFPILR